MVSEARSAESNHITDPGILDPMRPSNPGEHTDYKCGSCTSDCCGMVDSTLA